MSTFSDYKSFDAVGLAKLIQDGEITPEEAVASAMKAIDDLNPALNAVTTVFAERALAAARAELPAGPLRGVPFLVKDLTVSIAGVPTNCGSRFFQGWTRDFDSEILKRWRAAGLIVVGKTNTPELGSSGSTEPVATGATHNPWSLDHTPGGSSGGSAAAVAAGIVPAAHANDAGGSIRGPASCCGLVGLKPTRGRNSLGPDASEYWNGMVVEHVVTRSVRDSAAILDATAGPLAGDPYMAPPPARPFLDEVLRDPGRLRIAFATRDPIGRDFDPNCLRATTQTAQLLEDLGHHVEEASPTWDLEVFGATVMNVFAAAVARDIEERSADTGIPPSNDVIEKNNLWLWERGRSLSAIDMLRAIGGLNTVSRQFAPFFEEYDAWLTPTMAQLPPKLGYLFADVDDVELFFERLWRFNPFNSIYNATGLPAISLPLHMSEDGLPVGMMLGSRFGEEALLFRIAGQLERALPWRDRHPPISLWT
jgi:amidase